jgi:hypothetical protein
VIAIGDTSLMPLTDQKSGSVKVPTGKKGDLYVIWAFVGGPGGSGKVVYKYVYEGTAPSPSRLEHSDGRTPADLVNVTTSLQDDQREQ